MKLQNFTLGQDGISLNWDGHNLDLHNDYDFKSLCYELTLKQVALSWEKSAQPWVSDAALAGLQLVFKNVSFWRVKERDVACPFTEDNCLMHLSFHPVTARDEFDSISLESSPTDDLTFFFQSEWGIKLNAETVELVAAW